MKRSGMEGVVLEAPVGHEFERGYYCAVATLLREEGDVTTQVLSLFRQGGGAEHADEDDIWLFVNHGLMEPNA